VKTYLITGAGRGIGLALAQVLGARGDTVIATVRKSVPELAKLGVRVEADVDVASTRSMEALAARLKDTPIDGLVCNAGLLSDEGLDDLDEEAVRRQFEVNAMGPLRTVRALKGNLMRGAKVALITSRMGSIADNTSGGYYAYRMSKAALNAAGVSMARDLAPAGIAVGLFHPGFVKTDMTGNNGDIDAAGAARGLVARLDALTLENTGGFWHRDGSRLPW
jgi:NAD(P)-dependent dehydrogenase (short-subunit alcohol dehydrogenase family)